MDTKNPHGDGSRALSAQPKPRPDIVAFLVGLLAPTKQWAAIVASFIERYPGSVRIEHRALLDQLALIGYLLSMELQWLGPPRQQRRIGRWMRQRGLGTEICERVEVSSWLTSDDSMTLPRDTNFRHHLSASDSLPIPWTRTPWTSETVWANKRGNRRSPDPDLISFGVEYVQHSRIEERQDFGYVGKEREERARRRLQSDKD